MTKVKWLFMCLFVGLLGGVLSASQAAETDSDSINVTAAKLLPKVKNIKQRFLRRDRLYCTYHYAA